MDERSKTEEEKVKERKKDEGKAGMSNLQRQLKRILRARIRGLARPGQSRPAMTWQQASPTLP